MRRLLSVEFRRFFARDLARLFGLLILVGSLLGGATAFVNSLELDDATAARIDSEIRHSRATYEQRLDSCVRGSQPSDLPPEVRENLSPEILQQPRHHRECVEQLRVSAPGDLRFHFGANSASIFGTLGIPTAIIAWILGASLIGAEWSAGTITPLLTWEPRRLRVLGAKTLGLLLAVGAGFLLMDVLVAAALLPAGFLRGTFADVDIWWLKDVANSTWRGMALAGGAGLLGFGLANLIRNTVAAVGAGFGYLIIVENLVRALTPRFNQWLLSSNAAIAGLGYDPGLVGGRSPETALMILGGYALGIYLLGAVLFWRRDVSA